MDDTFIKESIKKEKKNLYIQLFIKYFFIIVMESYMIWKHKLVCYLFIYLHLYFILYIKHFLINI